MRRKKKRIAILGGGMASVAAAFELTNHPHWQNDYDVSIYTAGFRLGGKGASGRNRALADRIEEHGLHIFSGSYDNTFALLRQCYAELDRPEGAPMRTIEDVFTPHHHFVLKGDVGSPGGDWVFDFPPNEAVPGIAKSPSLWTKSRRILDLSRQMSGLDTDIASPFVYVKAIVTWLIERFRTEQAATGEVWIADADTVRQEVAHHFPFIRATLEATMEMPNPLRATMDVATNLISSFGIAAGIGWLALAAALVEALPDAIRLEDARLLRAVSDLLRTFRESFSNRIAARVQENPSLYRLWISSDLAITCVVGMIADGLIFSDPPWQSIDDLELREWLRKHGAAEETADAPPTRVVREFLFSDGTGVAAGIALYAMLRLLFAYKGAFSFKMQCGMGDAVFAPLYLVLRRRGVHVHFFHRVDRLEASADGRHVAKIHMGRQATVKAGSYDPLYDVDGLPCWPTEPLYDQLEEGDALRASQVDLEASWTEWKDPQAPLVLEAGRDFDSVVLGISIGAFPRIATELMDRHPPFRAMVENVATTQTRAMQLWFQPMLSELGHEGPSPIVGTYARPFDTWADMSHLLRIERWPASANVGSLVYLCSRLDDDEPPPLCDPTYPARQLARVHRSAARWLDEHAQGVWPGTTDAHGHFDAKLLVDLQNGEGPARLKHQYFRAPTSLSERYVMSVPGTTRYRLRENASGFANVVLAGDWVLTPLSAGFVEAATVAGLQAAHAIRGGDAPILGVKLPDVPGSFDRDFDASRRAETGLRHLAYVDANFVPGVPFSLQKTRMFTFVLPADAARLQALCTTMLDTGGDLEYRPLGAYVALVCADITHIQCENPPSWIPEKDFGFWIPVVAGRRSRGTFVPERTAFFIPYIWVDSPLAMMVGREIHGFQKGMGTLTVPSSIAEPGRFSLDAWAVERYGSGFSPESKWSLRPIFEVTPRAAKSKPSGTFDFRSSKAFTTITDLYRLFDRETTPAPTLSLLQDLIQTTRDGSVRLVYLKQFPDILASAQATQHTVPSCYRAIIEAPCVLSGGMQRFDRLPGSYSLELHEYDSCRIAHYLGLDGRRTGPRTISIDIPMFFVCEFDFTLGEGVVVANPGRVG